MTPRDIRDIAQIAAEAGHDVVMIFVRAIGEEPPVKPWINSPSWIREASLAVVGAIMADPSISPGRQHEIRRAYLERIGYPEAQGRPELKPWEELAEQHQVRQTLFGAAVRGVLTHYAEVIGQWPTI